MTHTRHVIKAKPPAPPKPAEVNSVSWELHSHDCQCPHCTPNPAPAPGDDGDRDTENPDIELPVPINEPVWQDELRHYHSRLCECSACAEANSQHQSRIQEFVRKTIQW